MVEVRHESWNRPETLSYFTERNVAFCNIDQPLIGRSLEATEHVTSPVGYVRLHGRNYDQWFEAERGEDRYNYLYSEAELAGWKEKIERIAHKAEVTYVVANNHFEAKAGVNALQMKHMLSGQRVKATETLLEALSRAEEYCRSVAGRQRRIAAAVDVIVAHVVKVRFVSGHAFRHAASVASGMRLQALHFYVEHSPRDLESRDTSLRERLLSIPNSGISRHSHFGTEILSRGPNPHFSPKRSFGRKNKISFHGTLSLSICYSRSIGNESGAGSQSRAFSIETSTGPPGLCSRININNLEEG